MKRLIILGLLAGCAQAPAPTKPLSITQTVYLPFVVPPYLSQCDPDPAPGTWTHDSDVARYMVALKSAGDGCRNTLAALVFAASQPTVK